MPDQAPWPPPGGRHRAAGLTGPTRRYALIVLVLAVTSSLPILAAIGPGAGSVDEALAGDDLGDTTPFIPPPSPGPVVVIPIRPGLPERPPPPLATLPAPAGATPPPRRPTRQTSAKPAAPVAPARHPEAAQKRAKPKQHRPRVEPPKPPRVVRKRKLWDRPPASLVHPCRQPRWQPPAVRVPRWR
ncbi:hypothetical protein SAMN05421812_119108 [Asanoa hainanensis]|uniref:Uncharacterized protein n=1 Tax=Asanoa hainanensis TaxID=560556 RepID=A0A239PEF0_9ACTN|nr:hypothetical protein [Asanoa hainanensis]SNT65038.1 hypothetical protein SAMN05421812_119108 [Asanoa hainanensis]